MKRDCVGTLLVAQSRRVLDVTEDVAFKWRLLVEEGRKAGHMFSQ
jgi:hypothetical protein